MTCLGGIVGMCRAGKCGVFTLSRVPCALAKPSIGFLMSPLEEEQTAIAGFPHALRFVVGDFNMPCHALGLCTVSPGSDDHVSVTQEFHARCSRSRIGRQE
jgi:hypothetical protein